MKTSRIPWDEKASLVKELGGRDREIAAEGRLAAIISQVSKLENSAWWRYRIAFPDRPLEPFEFTQDEFEFLLSERRSG